LKLVELLATVRVVKVVFICLTFKTPCLNSSTLCHQTISKASSLFYLFFEFIEKKPRRIAIQGIEGSFHEWAASLFYQIEKPNISSCSTFRTLARQVAFGMADAGIMAIENTLAGSILPNYALLEEIDLWVTGEIYLPIHQCLLALPGQDMESVL